MLIGEVARKYNVPLETLRYYDRIGLLSPARRSGQRFYSDADTLKLEKVLKMRSLMFSLEETRELLALDDHMDRDLELGGFNLDLINSMRSAVKTKHDEVLRREEELRRIRTYLEGLLDKIDGVCQ